MKTRFPALGDLVDGKPLVLVKNDEWQMEAMRKMRLEDDDVMAAARTKGVKTLDDIKYAVLERNGGISVIEKDDD